MISQFSQPGVHGFNQDACGYLKQKDKIIMAVADGHGHYLHFRSDIGSQLAVESAIQVFMDCTSHLEDLRQREQRIQQVWIDSVLSYHKEHMVSSFEWAKARKYAPLYIDEKIPIEIAYGTTLLACVYFLLENKLFVFRVGDGELYKVSTFRMEELLQKNDYGSEYITESLCEIPLILKDNLDHPSFEKGLTSKDVLILATDGLSKFKNKKEIMYKIRKDVAGMNQLLSSLDNIDDLTVIAYKI
ncbi:MAG: protein phosphatase 2C domain-containing protein [Floccifex sp.]